MSDGVGTMTTLGTLYGQNMTSSNDLFYSSLYRACSIFGAIVLTLMACYVVHLLLNRFEVTRLGDQS